MSETLPPQKPKPRLSIFSNPIIGMTGWVATVLGLLLSIYFYIETREFPQLTYYVNPVRAVVYGG